METHEEFVKKAKEHRDKYKPKKSFVDRCIEQHEVEIKKQKRGIIMYQEPEWWSEWVYFDEPFKPKLKEDAPEDVKKAFEEWIKESDDV